MKLLYSTPSDRKFLFIFFGLIIWSFRIRKHERKRSPSRSVYIFEDLGFSAIGGLKRSEKIFFEKESAKNIHIIVNRVQRSCSTYM